MDKSPGYEPGREAGMKEEKAKALVVMDGVLVGFASRVDACTYSKNSGTGDFNRGEVWKAVCEKIQAAIKKYREGE